MKTRKLLSLLLALMMMLSVVPFYASAATALKASNVETWPTVTYKTADGKMYYGQTQEEALIINDDEVVKDANGNIVDGYFVFSNPSQIPSAGERKATITFVPATEEYTGFKKSFSSVKYTVEKITPSYIDGVNDPVIATEVEPGALLSTSILSGGKMTNPYNPDEPNLLAAEWIWSPSENEPSTTVVSESGYYTAQFLAAEYNMVTAQVYVKVASDIPETTIAEYPTIPELTYNPDVTWSDIALVGGKAVIKGTYTEVEGTFAIKDIHLEAAPHPDATKITVVFTPANAEAALPYEFTIPVKVNPAPISFGDDFKGTSIDDPFEFEVAPGTKMSYVQAYLMDYLNYPPQSVIGVEDYNGYAQNGRTYKLTVQHDNKNYVGTEAYFTVKFKNVELTPTIKTAGVNKYRIDCGDYAPVGTFTIYCNGEVIAETKEGQPFECVTQTDEGGTYNITAKYNPTENDYFIVSDATYSVTVAPKRNITTTGSAITITVNGSKSFNDIRTGDVIEIESTFINFAGWKITDASGKEVTLDGVDANANKITFTMPDHDLVIADKIALTEEENPGDDNGGFDIDNIFGSIDLGNLTEGDSDNAIVNIFNNIIAWIKNIIVTITNLFRSIGDNT